MERQDLQFYGQINLTHVNTLCHIENDRRKVEDAGHSRRYQPVADRLRGTGRSGDHADRHLVLNDQVFELIGTLDGQPPDPATHNAGVRIQKRRDAETAGDEAAVVGQGAAQVARADDDHGPVLGQPEGPGDLVDQVVDVVADPADAVRAQVGQVLAELGRVHAGPGRQL